ncbi:MAG: peptide-methionine (S)-S-oxide reductase MsrA [Vicinamibacteraceae bacterium]
MARALLAVAAGVVLTSVVVSGASSVSGVERPVGHTERAQTGDKHLAKATFAGGCFWCMEGPFDELDGVVSTTSGYTGGRTRNPTYEEVSAGGTGHAEAVEIVYDPAKISYERLLEVFWRNVDPLDSGGQFCDRGAQYRTAIFAHDAEQRAAAEKSKAALQSSGRLHGKIVTEIVDLAAFYRAEDYHQDYYQTNPLRYKYYRFTCGRDRRLKALWGDAATH